MEEAHFMKRRIVYIGGFELPDKNAAAHRVLNNAKIMQKLGMEVIFVGITHDSCNKDILKTEKVMGNFRCFTCNYPKSKKEWIKYLIDATDYIKVIKSVTGIEAVICYNFQALSLRKIINFCKKNNIKCYSDVTEWYSAKGRGIAFWVLKGLDTWYRMKVLHKKQDGLIVISRYLERYYKKCTNIIYIPALTDKEEEKWKEQCVKSNDVILLVYAGSPVLKDRVDKLIEAVPLITRRFQIDIVGITKAQYLEMYPLHKGILENYSNIIFHGRLSHLETLEYVKRANYSCFFRDVDRVSMAGFSTKFVEAISCGTPVITNNTSNLSEYIKGYCNGILISGNDSRAISEAINNASLTMPVKEDMFDYHQFIEQMRDFLGE